MLGVEGSRLLLMSWILRFGLRFEAGKERCHNLSFELIPTHVD
jgi:hypothetical protein